MSATIIAIANQKGGVGKTTTTVNLAAALVEAGRRVLVIDLDPQANATANLGIVVDQGQATTYEVLQREKARRLPLADVLLECEGIHVAPASIDIAGLEIDLASMMFGKERVLRDALAPLVAEYDVVLLDCPPSLGILTVNALVAASHVLVPVQMGVWSVSGMGKLLTTISEVRESNSRLQLLGILLTMVEKSQLSSFVRDEAHRLLTTLELPPDLIIPVEIQRAVVFGEAPINGTSIYRYSNPDKMVSIERARDSYRQLAEEVLNRVQ